ncbi:MAG: type I-A CRISPR-associated protein Cas5, partial [Thermoprotei archaeon]
MVYVALVKVKLPFFSIRNPESFQVGLSLPIPPPSTLIGSLAYALAVEKGLGSKDALNEARNSVILARATLVATAPAIPNSVLLWRYRILDKKGEVLKLLKSKENDYTGFKRELELKFKDALHREYLFISDIVAAYILRKRIDAGTFSLIPRLGDTESLCSIGDVKILSCNEIRAIKIRTSYPFKYNAEMIKGVKGDFMFLRMTDELRAMKPFVVPIRRKFIE